MRTRLFFKLIPLLIISSFAMALETSKDWVYIGQHKFNFGYQTPYRIYMEVPKGQYNIEDIKKGLQAMRFRIKWLPPELSEQEVRRHFQKLLLAQFNNPEDIKFNQPIIDRLLNKLPAVKRGEIWLFTYSPQAGTGLWIDNKRVHQIIGAEVNKALREAWLFASPVSTAQLLKRLIRNRKNVQK